MSPSSDETQVVTTGLTSPEAEARLARFGPNEPATSQHHSILSDILHVFMNPLVLILVIAAVASAFLGEKVDAAIIGAIVLLSAAMDFSQTYRSQRAVERLHDQVAPTATVQRDGEWKEIRRRDLVPGDLVRLSAGDMVPADARLLTARDLYVLQAALTGESLPTAKAATSDAGLDQSGCAQHGFSRHLGRKWDGNRGGRRHRARELRSATLRPAWRTSGRDGLRSRPARF